MMEARECFKCIIPYYPTMSSQYRGKFSNMNIFSSMIPLEAMMMRTSGYGDCTGPGDYLGWADMEWSVSGDVASGVVNDNELCQRYKRFTLKIQKIIDPM